MHTSTAQQAWTCAGYVKATAWIASGLPIEAIQAMQMPRPPWVTTIASCASPTISYSMGDATPCARPVTSASLPNASSAANSAHPARARPLTAPNVTQDTCSHPRPAHAHPSARWPPGSTTPSPVPASCAHRSATSALGTGMMSVYHASPRSCSWKPNVWHIAAVGTSVTPSAMCACTVPAVASRARLTAMPISAYHVRMGCICTCPLPSCLPRGSA